MANLVAVTAPARQWAGLGPMTKFMAHKTLDRLSTIPHTTLAATHKQKIWQVFVKDHLEHSITITEIWKFSSHRTFNGENFTIGGEEVDNIVTWNFIRKVLNVQHSHFLAVSGNWNVFVPKARAF